MVGPEPHPVEDRWNDENEACKKKHFAKAMDPYMIIFPQKWHLQWRNLDIYKKCMQTSLPQISPRIQKPFSNFATVQKNRTAERAAKIPKEQKEREIQIRWDYSQLVQSLAPPPPLTDTTRAGKANEECDIDFGITGSNELKWCVNRALQKISIFLCGLLALSAP